MRLSVFFLAFPLARVDAVITIAAGNGGAACATQDLNGCNAVAVAMAYQAATNSSTIVVGALSVSGSSVNIAAYSKRAGVLLKDLYWRRVSKAKLT